MFYKITLFSQYPTLTSQFLFSNRQHPQQIIPQRDIVRFQTTTSASIGFNIMYY